MAQPPIARRFLTPLVAVGLVLTVAVAVVLIAARVVGALGDQAGARILDSVALAVALLWLVDVICLLLALGVNALGDSASDDESE